MFVVLQKEKVAVGQYYNSDMGNKTIEYYNANAQGFASSTITADMFDNCQVFEALLPHGAYILDFGCGSGRDTKHFLEQGFIVDAIDGSEQLCRIASEYSGVDVKNMLFQDLGETDKYDGIWACSSILHLPKTELKEVFHKVIIALKADGIIYTSFKYGDFSGERNGRFFTDFTENTFEEFLKGISGIEVEKEWISSDVRPGREDEKWLNLILRKTS